MVKKTTVQLIQEVTGQLESAITLCASEKKKSVIEKELTKLKQSVSGAITHLTDNEKRKFIDVRKNLKAVYNVVDGSLEGLSSGDLTRREFRGVLNTLRTRFYPNVCVSLSVEVEKAENATAQAIVLTDQQEALKAELAESADIKDALKVVKKAVQLQEPSTAPRSEITDVATVTQLHAVAETRSLLPVRLKTDFQVIRLPIVPMFSNPSMNNPATFAKLGIKHVLVEGYAILQDQILIAVSDAKASRAGMTTLQFAQSVVSLLSERGTTEYEFVSDRPQVNPRNADLKLFWVLPKPKMNALMRIALSGRNASSITWGLPY